ncbi:GPR139 [Branchiostoma lanceolatum]|uniref:GPR139 protein n=1 Tax=Branchiostoma lanceolatum TaxID=7740 RepID=A0A8J9ZAI8_BRALA|nr:GPR139 [Branchiostoma lanceolatum]
MDQEEALLIAIKVYYSLLVIVGLPANVLTLYILLQRCKRSGEDRCTSSLYLIALAIADSLVLITIVIIYQMILSMVPPGEFCPYLNMLDYGAHNASIWIIVAYTIERFIGVYFPVWKYKVSNPTTAKFAISGVFMLSYLFALSHFFTMRLWGESEDKKRDKTRQREQDEGHANTAEHIHRLVPPSSRHY